MNIKILGLVLCLSIVVLALGILTATPTNAQGNDGNTCTPEFIFASTTPLRFSIGGGDYLPVPPQAEYYLKQITACPITYPIPVGAYQPLSILADGDALTARMIGGQVYVYRAWKIYPLSLQQWEWIVAVVEIKVPTNKLGNRK